MAHHGIFTTLLMGVALAEFGLTGLTGPSGSGASEPQSERTVAVAVADQRAGSEPREFGASNIIPQDISPEQYSAGVMDKIIPPATQGGPPLGYESPRGEMTQDIDNGVYYLDRSVRQIPGYAMKMVGQVEKHGIAALAYTDPEMKRAGHELGTEVGTGIRHLISALGKDMVATAHESMGNQRR